jgi:hypothetical protein
MISGSSKSSMLASLQFMFMSMVLIVTSSNAVTTMHMDMDVAMSPPVLLHPAAHIEVCCYACMNEWGDGLKRTAVTSALPMPIPIPIYVMEERTFVVVHLLMMSC